MSSTQAAVDELLTAIRKCVVCTASLPAGPRPIVQFGATSRVLIIGQAPGSKVHASGVPWDDASGDRLREWTGLSKSVFYDPARVALAPMGFCYPGAGDSGDLPPRPECAPLWHPQILRLLPTDRLTLLVGAYAQARYLPSAKRQSMTEAVRGFADTRSSVIALPHPSWRSGIWMRNNPWFETDVLPRLRAAMKAAIA
jgi:uracil-DNA glycosylase